MRPLLSLCRSVLRTRSPARGAARLLTAGLAIATLASCSEQAAAPPRVPERVKVAVVSFAPIERTISLTGTVEARVESDLSFRTAGKIAERKVDVSDHVKAGDVLATLDTQEQDADVQSARATLVAAQATAIQAQTNFDRQKQLLDSGFTTRSTFDAAQEQLRTAQSSVLSARADVETAQDQLSFTVLKADADGVVITRNAEAGQVVSAAQTVFTVAQDGARDATFDIYEALLAGAPPKEDVAVRLVADPSVTAFAKIREISPTFDTTTGTVRVKMSLIDAPAAMGLGAAVYGTGKIASDKLIVLPWTALSAGEKGPAVWVVNPETKAVSQRQVTIDRYRTGQILIRDGLKDGETVVTAGGQFLRDGQIVTIAPPEAAGEAS